MKDNTDYKLLKEVNPVFTTAQACLLVMAEAGDADAKRLVSQLGFDEGIASVEKDALTEMEKFQKMKSIPGFTTMIEARFTASSNLIRSRQAKVIIDLPCGYTPRGLRLARGESLYNQSFLRLRRVQGDSFCMLFHVPPSGACFGCRSDGRGAVKERLK